MKEHRKNITSSDVLEMMVRAGLKPASELERLHVEADDADAETDQEDGPDRRPAAKKRVA